MELPKNIYFYWDTLEIPEEALNNVKNYKAQNRDFNVKILNDEDINIYKNEFPELIELFHLATISALIFASILASLSKSSC
jgi:mannosyltransferase OCH1-like enzyme